MPYEKSEVRRKIEVAEVAPPPPPAAPPIPAELIALGLLLAIGGGLAYYLHKRR